MNMVFKKYQDIPATKPSCAPADFKSLDLSDRPILEKVLSKFPQPISGFTFATLFVWNPVYKYTWSPCGKDTLLIACDPLHDGKQHFLQPVGGFDGEAEKLFLDVIRTLDYPAKIFGVSDAFIKKNPGFVSHFDIENNPDLANYTYRTEDLAALAGKFYAKKRNLIAQANHLYQYSIHSLDENNIHECLPFLESLDAPNGEQDSSAQNEKLALKKAILNFSRLPEQGLAIKIDGKLAAFSIFEPLTPDTAVIHFEKASREYKGLYQIINQEAAKTIAGQGFSLINREEDMGIPGLRQAKLSYGPVEIVPSYTLTFNVNH